MEPQAPDSEEDDDDYVPQAESDEEGPAPDGEDAVSDKAKGRKKKARAEGSKRGRRGGITLSDEEPSGAKRRKAPLQEADDRGEGGEESEADQPEGGPAKPQSAAAAATEKSVDEIFEEMKRSAQAASGPTAAPAPPNPPAPKLVTVKETLEYAGETITVEKKVAAEQVPIAKPAAPKGPSSSLPALLQKGAPKPKAGGLDQLLAKLNPKKISTLEKSKMDWDKFKHTEGIEDELARNQKAGYLDKQAFLQRADIRQFEQERDARAKTRKPPSTGGAGL